MTKNARLDGSGVVTVHEAGTEGRRAFFVMDLMEAGSLRDRLRRGPLPPLEAAKLVARLARTLARCHELGLIHRDVKPDNVLFDERGEPRLADFGCVRDLAASALTASGVTLGTCEYMAPEQLRGEKVGPPADVWALGIVLYELLTGERPYRGSPVGILKNSLEAKRTPVPRTVPRAIEAALDRALAPDPGRRPSASELADALLASRGAGPGKRRATLGLGIALVATAAASSVALVLALRGGRDERPVEAERPAPSPTPRSSPLPRPPSKEVSTAQKTVADFLAAIDSKDDAAPNETISDAGIRVRSALATLRTHDLGAFKEARDALLRRLWTQEQHAWLVRSVYDDITKTTREDELRRALVELKETDPVARAVFLFSDHDETNSSVYASAVEAGRELDPLLAAALGMRSAKCFYFLREADRRGAIETAERTCEAARATAVAVLRERPDDTFTRRIAHDLAAVLADFSVARSYWCDLPAQKPLFERAAELRIEAARLATDDVDKGEADRRKVVEALFRRIRVAEFERDAETVREKADAVPKLYPLGEGYDRLVAVAIEALDPAHWKEARDHAREVESLTRTMKGISLEARMLLAYLDLLVGERAEATKLLDPKETPERDEVHFIWGFTVGQLRAAVDHPETLPALRQGH
jgi:hypothetical protein